MKSEGVYMAFYIHQGAPIVPDRCIQILPVGVKGSRSKSISIGCGSMLNDKYLDKKDNLYTVKMGVKV